MKSDENKILGESKPDGTREGGLVSRIETEHEEMQTKRTSEEEAHEKLREKIEALLPGATSVGLAEAFKVQKDTYWWGGLVWPAIFITSVGTIVLVGTLSFHEVSAAQSINEAYVKLLARLPFYLAAVWLASFASKRQSQNKRLQQEYAHKETVSRSLEGYKREVEELDESGEILKGLMIVVVGMLGYNPSETLDKHHGSDKSPVASLFDWLRGRGKKPNESGDE